MATKIKNNLGAVRTLNTLDKNSRASQKDLRRISTGEKITSAADDASAYGISERMREKIRSLDQANQNTQNDLAMMKTAEGAVMNTVEILKTLKQKAIDSANDSNTDEDRRIMQKEVDRLIDQLDDNSLVTFNGKFLVNGDMSGLTKMVGAVWICDGLYLNLGDMSYQSPLELSHTLLTDLKDTDGNLLMEETDTFTITHVVNGKTYVKTNTVKGYDYSDLVTGSIPGKGWNLPPYEDGQVLGATLEHTFATLTVDGVIVGADNYAYGTGDPAFVAHVDYLPTATAAKLRALADKNGKTLVAPDFANKRYTYIASTHSEWQLEGITITIKDSGGKIKQHATDALKFTQLQHSEGPSGSNGGGVIVGSDFSRGCGCQSVNDPAFERHGFRNTRTERQRRQHSANNHT